MLYLARSLGEMGNVMESLLGSKRSSTTRLRVPRRTWLRGLRYLAPGLLIVVVTAGFDVLNALGSFGISIDWTRRTWLELYGGLLLLAFVMAFRGVWIDKEDLRLRTDVGDELVRWQRLIRDHVQETPRTEMEYKAWESRAEDLLASLHAFLRDRVSSQWARAVERLDDIPPADTRHFWNSDAAGFLRRLKRTDERISQFLELTPPPEQTAGQTSSDSRERLARIRR